MHFIYRKSIGKKRYILSERKLFSILTCQLASCNEKDVEKPFFFGPGQF